MNIPKENWEQFVISICVHLIVPLLPIILIMVGSISMSEKELHLFTTLWAFHICTSSKERIGMFVIGITGIIMLGMLDENLVKPYHDFPALLNDWRFTFIVVLLFFHIYERVITHLLIGDEYFKIRSKKTTQPNAIH